LRISTTRFGTLEIREDQIIHVPSGLIGFPEYKRYVLLEHRKDSSFYWFQAVDNEALAFVVINPLLFQPDYSFELSPEDRQVLQILDGQNEIQTLAIVNIIRTGKEERAIEITANLLGPIVVNIQKRLARQLILETSPYSHRHPIPQIKNKPQR
jgi:flagellar assembly factor FliW